MTYLYVADSFSFQVDSVYWLLVEVCVNSRPPRGRLMQAWESEGGIPLIENRNQFRFKFIELKMTPRPFHVL